MFERSFSSLNQALGCGDYTSGTSSLLAMEHAYKRIERSIDGYQRLFKDFSASDYLENR